MFLLIEYIGWMEILPIKNKPEPKIFSYFFLLVQCSPRQQIIFLSDINSMLKVYAMKDSFLKGSDVSFWDGGHVVNFETQKKMYPAILYGGDSRVASECWENLLLDKFI